MPRVPELATAYARAEVTGRSDIVVFGTGSFAARILFDLAAAGPPGLTVTIVGRNVSRLAWLRTAGAARAAMFETGVQVSERQIPEITTATAHDVLTALRPRVVVNTASVQGGRAPVSKPDRWSRLVARAGLGVTAILQARLSLAVSRAVANAVPRAGFVNCCYPDVVNTMIAGAGLPITSGIGNVAILAHAFAGLLGPDGGRLQILAQHAALAAFRRAPEERAGKPAPRVWIDGREIADVFARFSAVQLAPEPVIDISGASGVPLFVAMARDRPWRGHVPGPNGLPGGYPVRLEAGAVILDLPDGLNAGDAIAWNAAFEQKSGVVVEPDGVVRYTGRVAAGLHAISPELAAGFRMGDFAAADAALSTARQRLQQETD